MSDATTTPFDAELAALGVVPPPRQAKPPVREPAWKPAFRGDVPPW